MAFLLNERRLAALKAKAKVVWGNMLTEELIDGAKTQSERLLAKAGKQLAGASALAKRIVRRQRH